MAEQPSGFKELLSSMMKRRWFITAIVLGGFMIIIMGIFGAILNKSAIEGEWKEKRTKDICDSDDSRSEEEKDLFTSFSLLLKDLGVDVRTFTNNFDIESVVRFKNEIKKS